MTFSREMQFVTPTFQDFFTEQLQTLQMRAIANLQCMIMHDGTGAKNVVTAEKVCTVDRDPENSGGVCGGQILYIDLFMLSILSKNKCTYR